MKGLLLILFLLGSLPTIAQENSVKLQEDELKAISSELDATAERSENFDEQKKLKKVGAWFKEASKKTGRGLGIASSVVFTETLRPFIATGSFFRGAFTKLDSQDAKMRNFIFNFYLDNEKDLQELYRNKELYTQHLQCDCSEGSIYQDFSSLIVEHFKLKALGALKDVLNQIGFNPVITDETTGQDISLLDATSIEELLELVGQIDLERNQDMLLAMMDADISNDLIRNTLKNHGLEQLGEYIDISPLYEIVGAVAMGGELNEEDLLTVVDTSIVEELKEFGASFVETEDGKVWKNKKLLTEIGEPAGALIAQFSVPSIALGTISGTAAGIYTGVVSAAALGTGISAAVCSTKKGKQKILVDEDFRNFCSYVVFRTSLKLVKSKSKGFLAGQKFRKYMKGHKAHRVDRRNEIKSCIESGNSKKECRKTFKEQKSADIQKCIESGKSKRQCKRERREVLRIELNIQ